MRFSTSMYQYDLCLRTAYGTIPGQLPMRTLPGRASNFMSPPLSYNQIIPVAYIEVHAFSLNDLFTVTYGYFLFLYSN